MRASAGDNLLLPPHNGQDGAFLVLVGDRGEPSNYAVRAEPSFVLINEDDEAEQEEDPGENRTFLDDEEDEEPQPRKTKKTRAARNRNNPRSYAGKEAVRVEDV